MAVTFSSWRKKQIWPHQIIVFLVILILLAGVGYATFEEFQQGVIDVSIPRFLIDPYKGFTGPPVSLGVILANRFSLDDRALRRLDSVLTGLLLGLFIIFIAFCTRIAVGYLSRKRSGVERSQFTPTGYYSLVLLVAIGVLLSPTRYLGGGKFNYDCSGDVFASYRVAGDYLAQVVPPYSSVYWKGGLSVAPLLYVQNIRIYPPQINSDYSYYRGGNPQELLKLGLWNETLNAQWLREADFLLIEDRYYRGKLRNEIENLMGSGQLQELPAAPAQVACRPSSMIRIFLRIR